MNYNELSVMNFNSKLLTLNSALLTLLILSVASSIQF